MGVMGVGEGVKGIKGALTLMGPGKCTELLKHYTVRLKLT